MPGNKENEIKAEAKQIYVDYAESIGRDVSNVTKDTKLKFPAGLKLSPAEMGALKVPLNELIEPYGAQFFVETEVTAFKTIKAAQTAVWDRVKSTV